MACDSQKHRDARRWLQLLLLAQRSCCWPALPRKGPSMQVVLEECADDGGMLTGCDSETDGVFAHMRWALCEERHRAGTWCCRVY